MAVEVQTSISFTCDLCGRSQVTSPAPADPLICQAAAQAEISANLDTEKRVTIRMELCDRCYGVLVNLVTELQARFRALPSREPSA